MKPSLPPFLEFFSGIGAFAAAAPGLATVVQPFDQDALCNETYQLNFHNSPSPQNLSSPRIRLKGKPGEVSLHMSPPCQPYTKKGKGLDVDDPRARAFLNIVGLLPSIRPRHFLLENVPPFQDSESRMRLLDTLDSLQMDVAEVLLCPTQLGIPNRRQRYFLLASTQPLGPQSPLPQVGYPLKEYLDPKPDPALFVSPEFEEKHRFGLDVVTLPSSPDAKQQPLAVFGSSYGHAVARAGSYLRTEDGHLRRFSPKEILRLLHFPNTFHFPQSMRQTIRYRLAGNSMNVAVVRYLLQWLLGEG